MPPLLRRRLLYSSGSIIKMKKIKNYLNQIKSLKQKSLIGVDISDRSIEVAKFFKEEKKQSISFGRAVLESGIVENGRIINADKLALALNKAMESATPKVIKPGEAVFGMPESQTYYHIFSTNDVSANGLRIKALKEAENSIPYPINDVIFSYKIIGEKMSVDKTAKKDFFVLLIATERKVYEEWLNFFQSLKIKIEIAEPEIIAGARCVKQAKDKEVVCLVDIGGRTTIISLLNKKGVFYTYPIKCGGDLLTEKIIEDAKTRGEDIGWEQAEEKKIKETAMNVSENPIGVLAGKVFLPIIDEIRTAILYGQSSLQMDVEKIILLGGSSEIIGLNQFIETSINSSLIGESIIKRIVENGQLDFMDKVDIKYAEAIGLAARIFSSDEKEVGFVTLTKNEEKKERQFVADFSGTGTKKSDSGGGLDKKVKILIAILVVGLLMIPLSFWYRNQSVKQKQDKLSEKTAPGTFSHAIEINVKIPLTTDSASSLGDAMRGESLKETIQGAMSYEKAVEIARSNVSARLGTGVTVWSEPIKLSSSRDSLVFPLDIYWLSYSSAQMESMFLGEVKKKVGDVKFLLNSLDVVKIKPESDSLFSIFGIITISVDSPLEIQNDVVIEEGVFLPVVFSPVPVSVTKKEAIVNKIADSYKVETLTNLKIRSKADVSGGVIRVAKKGEILLVADENVNWVKVIENGKEIGWAMREYVRRVK